MVFKRLNNTIRIVTTNGSPYSKALELFKALTKNAQSINVQSNGVRVANMGNGNYITFRPESASTSGFEATISLDFSAIWSNVRHVKFQ